MRLIRAFTLFVLAASLFSSSPLWAQAAPPVDPQSMVLARTALAPPREPVAPTGSAAAAELVVRQQEYAYCQVGEAPQFRFGFADLKAQLGPRMGEPSECEHQDSGNGDTLQQTSLGLAQYRASTNIPSFTNGWDHWAIVPGGVVHWVGPETDVPVGASLLPPAALSPVIPAEMVAAWDLLFATPAPPDSGKATLGDLAGEWLIRSNVKVVIGPLDGAWAAYSGRINTIIVTPHVLDDIPAAVAVVFVHELRHAAQQVEGQTDCVGREVDSLVWEMAFWNMLTNGGVPKPTTQLQREENYLLQIALEEGEPGLYKYVVTSPGYQEQCQIDPPY